MAQSESAKKRFAFFRKFRSFSKETRLLLIAFMLIAIGTLFSSLLLTDFGKIEVTEITVPTQNGQWIVADLYKPVTATENNKAPVVVVCPGFQRTKETQTNMALELARRGIVVVDIDPYAQGDSSASMSTQAATTEGYGVIPMVEYLYDTPNINYIDKTRIGAAGHSAGGNAAIRSAAYFGTEAIDGTVPASKLAAIYISGYVLTLTDSVLSSIRSNIGMSYAYYDEGAYRNENAASDVYLDADMQYAPEAIRLVNSGLLLNSQSPVTSVQIDKLYGSPYDYTMRIVHNEKVLHAFQPYDNTSTANMINFFEIAFDMNFAINATNQTFMVKEAFQGLMLVGAMLFIFGFGGILLKTKFFSKIVHPVPQYQPKPTKSGKIVFWSIFTFSALVACFIFVPMAKEAQVLFWDAQNGIQTWFFPERMTNAVLLWAVFNGTLGIIIFFVMHFLKKNRAKDLLDPLKIKLKELGITLLFALTVFAAFYTLDYTIYHLFHVDFRFMFISARPLGNTNYLIVALMYMPLFFIFYLSNSIRVNMTMRLEGWSEFKSNLVGALGNSVGLVLILVIQYAVFAATGTVFWTTEWLYINIVFGLIPMMFILPIYNRYFFNRTGKVYSGAMVTCMIFIMMTLTNSVAYIPL